MSSTQIQVVNGKITNTTYQQLDLLFKSYLLSPAKPIVIYLHGGAISQKKVEDQISTYLSVSAFKEEDCFPIYVLYKSGIGEVIKNNLLEAFHASPIDHPQAEGLDGIQTILSKVIRSNEFSGLYKILFKRIVKKLAKKKIDLGNIGFESTGESLIWEQKLNNINSNLNQFSFTEEPREDFYDQLEELEAEKEAVEDYNLEELQALQEELMSDEEVRIQAQQIGFVPSGSGFEAAGTGIKFVVLIINILSRIIKRFIKKTDHGIQETLIEEILRQFVEGPLTKWWSTLKSDMDQAFTNDQPNAHEIYAGTVILSLLDKYWNQLQQGGERKVYLIGTSAGTTFLSKFLKAADTLQIHPDITFQTVFVVPSVTIEEIYDNIRFNRSRIQYARIFGLNEQFEVDDQVIFLYRKSILFLISGILEEEVATPLLGMERIYKNRAPFKLDQVKNQIIRDVRDFFTDNFDTPFIWSPVLDGPGKNNTGTRHQTMITNQPLLGSLNDIIKGDGVSTPQQPLIVNVASRLSTNQGGFESGGEEKKVAKLIFSPDTNKAEGNEWDRIYARISAQQTDTVIQENDTIFEEPTTESEYVFKRKDLAPSEFESTRSALSYNQFDPDWPPLEPMERKIWHLDDAFSQLASAREFAIQNTDQVVRIAHIDTGYDPYHDACPRGFIREDLQRSFIDGENPMDASDREIGKKSSILKQPGHGTGTLGMLAGSEVDIPEFQFSGPIGLYKNIEIVPIRIAKSVIIAFNNEVFARALDYLISLYPNPKNRVHIITMSMGGLASRVISELINKAYERGIFIVTAAGNNFAGKPTRTLVYPARFKRVVAACGVTHSFAPYKVEATLWERIENLFEMQGNYGPRKVMDYAMAAFTPNVPWAKAGSNNLIELSGAGTSSATPQIAMAAALYKIKYFEEIQALPEGWQKVEAIRYALFQSAQKSVETMSAEDFHLHFGQGILKARKMLDIVPDITKLSITAKDKIRSVISFVKLITGFESRERESEEINELLELELEQLIHQHPRLQEIFQHEEIDSFDGLDAEGKRAFVEEIMGSEKASQMLKEKVREYYQRSN